MLAFNGVITFDMSFLLSFSMANFDLKKNGNTGIDFVEILSKITK